MSGAVSPTDRADDLLAGLETPHPLVESAREALARDEACVAALHIRSMVVHRDADRRRLRRAGQALVCAEDGDDDA